METVTFVPVSHVKKRAETIVRLHQEKFRELLPGAEVVHIGSTAIDEGLTKGDVDILVRVSAVFFSEARSRLSRWYPRNVGSMSNHLFCAFETDRYELPLGIQLAVKGSEFDIFEQVTEALRSNEELRTRYDALKRKHEGGSMEEYRSEKAEFLYEVVQSTVPLLNLSPSSQTLNYKCLQGPDYLTAEDVVCKTTSEWSELLTDLEAKAQAHKKDRVLLVTKTADLVERDWLEQRGYRLRAETVKYFFDLANLQDEDFPFQWDESKRIVSEVESVWAEILGQTNTSASVVSAKRQVKNLQSELGEAYTKSLCVVKEGDEALGLLLPHEEPSRLQQGRLFYFGLLPQYRGKGMAATVHRYGLHLLRERFGADYYIGSTEVKNLPMRTVFQKNGCLLLGTEQLYEKWL